MKKRPTNYKISIDTQRNLCDNIVRSLDDGCGETLDYVFSDEGVQENALVQFPKATEDRCAISESRVFPYVNAQDCRQALLDAYTRYVRNQPASSSDVGNV